MLIFVYLFCLWLCFVRLFDVVKEQTIAIRHLLRYCHSLDGATLFSTVDSNKLKINVNIKMNFIDGKFDTDFINISEVTSRKTKWPQFLLACHVYTVQATKSFILSAEDDEEQVLSADDVTQHRTENNTRCRQHTARWR